MIDKYFEPWGYQLNGVVRWYGERDGHGAEISVTENSVAEYQPVKSLCHWARQSFLKATAHRFRGKLHSEKVALLKRQLELPALLIDYLCPSDGYHEALREADGLRSKLASMSRDN